MFLNVSLLRLKVETVSNQYLTQIADGILTTPKKKKN